MSTENNAQVYRGETIIFDFTLRDDNGDVITSIDDVVVLLTDMTDKQQPIVKRLGSDIVFDNGNLRFVIQPTESRTLPKRCGIEIKIIINGVVRIAVRQIMNVLDNKVKDY